MKAKPKTRRVIDPKSLAPVLKVLDKLRRRNARRLKRGKGEIGLPWWGVGASVGRASGAGAGKTSYVEGARIDMPDETRTMRNKEIDKRVTALLMEEEDLIKDAARQNATRHGIPGDYTLGSILYGMVEDAAKAGNEHAAMMLDEIKRRV